MEVIKLREKRYFYITDEDFEVAESNGIKSSTVKNRVYRDGWDIDRAIKQPIEVHDPSCKGWNEWKDKAVVGKSTYLSRVRKGWTYEEAALKPPMSLSEASKLKRKYSEEIYEIAQSNGISPNAVRYRVSQMKWDIEKAITTPLMSKGEAGRIAMEKRWN